ncbi:hypothetical protein, partial [Escherichia coli]|uniref:hypothetical protein n=1 Tax=Escherichia coli TaxID=562 RepID=UPI0013D32D71
CLLAPLIAILALSFTTRINQAFVLPVACAGLMATEIIGTAALASLSWIGVVPMLAFLVVMAAVLALAMAVLIVSRSSAVARPGLSRS